ncbi:hypothetical protein ACQJBY_000830 [Aegilops geniculata]
MPCDPPLHPPLRAGHPGSRAALCAFARARRRLPRPQLPPRGRRRFRPHPFRRRAGRLLTLRGPLHVPRRLLLPPLHRRLRIPYRLPLLYPGRPPRFLEPPAAPPPCPLARLVSTFILALALAFVIFFVSLAALLLLHYYVVGLPLQLLAAAVFLAGTAYVAVVCHLACVVPMLEDAVKFAALRKSRALLAGKFWAATAVFLALDGCFVALQLAFARLVLDDALGLGLGFQLAAGVATFVVLWAVVLLTLAAQPVIYMVCKNHHHEVVDKVHLDYIGDYERLAVDGDNGVELQPVTSTEQIPETTA